MIPIDKKKFSQFIIDTNLFELTQTAMIQCLKNWYNDDPKQFKKELVQIMIP